MKARVKSTGVLVDVTPKVNINAQHSGDNLYVCDNMVFRECELDFSAIDWEQRRYELAKAAMQGFCSNSHEQVMNASLNMTVEWSLGFADALIKKLKGAKLLKEKGFNWKCEHTISCDNIIRRYDIPQSMSCCTEIDNEPVEFLCPVLYVAQKWLRETKNLHIEISYMYGNYWIYDILTIPNHDLVGLSDRPIVRYNTYEEALEAGLQETLKLI